MTFADVFRLYLYRGKRPKGAALRRLKWAKKPTYQETIVHRDYFFRSFRSAIESHAIRFSIGSQNSNMFWRSALRTWGVLKELSLLESQWNGASSNSSEPLSLGGLISSTSDNLLNNAILKAQESNSLLTYPELKLEDEMRCLALADIILQLVAEYGNDIEATFKKLSKLAISIHLHSGSNRPEAHDFNIIWIFSILGTFAYVNENINHPNAEFLIRTTPLIASKIITDFYHLKETT